ncbi:MAG: hypothetical protein R3A44_20680 [Caldilineaceae bacterium]
MQIIEFLHQASDHPVAATFPEGAYLKDLSAAFYEHTFSSLYRATSSTIWRVIYQPRSPISHELTRPCSGGERGDLPHGKRASRRRAGALYPHGQELHLPLILRPTYDGVHSGQVGFPGGGYEESDGDLTATALREAV